MDELWQRVHEELYMHVDLRIIDTIEEFHQFTISPFAFVGSLKDLFPSHFTVRKFISGTYVRFGNPLEIHWKQACFTWRGYIEDEYLLVSIMKPQRLG
jgi:hypothetical protein